MKGITTGMVLAAAVIILSVSAGLAKGGNTGIAGRIGAEEQRLKAGESSGEINEQDWRGLERDLEGVKGLYRRSVREGRLSEPDGKKIEDALSRVSLRIDRATHRHAFGFRRT